MKRGGKENYNQFMIHTPGPEGNCWRHPRGDPVQFRVRRHELKAVDGYVRSWIPADDPIESEAV